jgi:hypothetical protein
VKPHAIRRVLWLTNFALGAAVVGAAAWYGLQVRPATADVLRRPINYIPPRYDKIRKEYDKARLTGLHWKPEAPVSEKEIHAVILRADYAKKSPTHWIFSGPLPPTETKTQGPVETSPAPPQGLDATGEITFALVDPDHPARSTVLFRFTDGKTIGCFGVGDFVRPDDGAPKRFRITAIQQPEPGLYVLHYDVYGKDPNKPERSGTLTCDRRKNQESFPFLRRVGEAATPAAPGTGTAGAPGATPGTPAGPTATPGTPPGEEQPEVVTVPSKPDESLTLEDLHPEVLHDPANSYNRGIQFDSDTYRYLKHKGAEGIASTVKTEIAKDSNGRPIGVRVTGFTPDAPADVFDVKRGDILVSINGQKVTSRAEAMRIAKSLDGKSLVRVVLDRRGRLITYNVDPQDPRNIRRVRYLKGFVK